MGVNQIKFGRRLFFVFYLLFAFLVSQLFPIKTHAATNFVATWNSGNFYLDYALGSTTPSTDGSWPSLVSPGYGGVGYALKNGNFLQVPSTTKYEVANNLTSSKGTINFKFKTLYDFKGDLGMGKFDYPDHIAYDPASGYLYIADMKNNRIIKTKFDGTGWQTLGYKGNRVHQFNTPEGIFYDSVNDFIYVSDFGNKRIVKTKIDGSGWTTLSSVPGVGVFSKPVGIFYDVGSEYIYITDTHRIIKTKIDGNGWSTYGTSGSPTIPGRFTWPYSVYYDSSSEYLYISTSCYIVKTKFDGTGWTYYGSWGSGVGQFNTPNQLYYDAASDYIYVADPLNTRIAKTKIDGTGWTTVNTSGAGKPNGISFDSSTGLVYGSSEGNNVFRVKMDGTGFEKYGTSGNITGNYVTNPTAGYGILGLAHDPVTKDNYTVDDYGRVVKTKIDGNGLEYVGHLDTVGSDQFGFSESDTGIDFDPTSGYLYVMEFEYNRIDKFKMDGSEWYTYGTGGTGTGQFASPSDIDYDDSGSGDLYISDSSNNRIVKTKFDGTGWQTLGTYGCGTGQFKNPSSVDYDPNSGYLYISDYWCNSIVKTKMDGSGWIRFGTFGSGVNQFKYPMGIDYDPTSDYVFVADYVNERVIKTKIDGTGWTVIGTAYGVGELCHATVGYLCYPKAVSYDSDTGLIHIADSLNQSIVETNTDYSNWRRYNATPIKKILWTSGSNPLCLYSSATEGRITFDLSQGNLPHIKSDPLILDEQTWHDLIIRWDSTTGAFQMYIDSTQVASATFSPWFDNDSIINGWGDYFYIGSDPNDYNEVWANLLDQFIEKPDFTDLNDVPVPLTPPDNPSNNPPSSPNLIPGAELPETGNDFPFLLVAFTLSAVSAIGFLVRKKIKRSN